MKWIKMYPEILHDRKMWKLKPMEQLAFFYLCLLAGQEDRNGDLPSLEDIELELRLLMNLKTAELVRIVDVLKASGMLSEEVRVHPVTGVRTSVLSVTNFASRQMSNMTEAERKAAQRDKQRTMSGHVSGQMSQMCPDTVPTDTSKMSGPDIDIEEDIEVEEELKERVNTSIALSADQANPPKAQKRRFGHYQHVLLTDDEYAKLSDKFPKDAAERIQKLDNYLENNRKKHYDNHYLTILTWARKDDAEAKPAQQQKRTYSFSEIVAMEAEGVQP